MSRLQVRHSNCLTFNQAKHVLRHLLPLAIALASSMVAYPVSAQGSSALSCQSLFTADFNGRWDLHKFRSFKSGIKPTELEFDAVQKISKIPEFEFIREQAEKKGLRVWLFGGTASSYLHYVKWNLQREKGIINLQADRFDFDYTNIFRSTQDLDIVIDADAAKAQEFEQLIANKFPHFLGAKAKWEVRTLRTRMGTPGQANFKEALLGDLDFSQQNTDSNSLGMVEVTRSEKIMGKHEPAIRDLKTWDQSHSQFMQDTLNNEISYFRSDKHFSTSRAKMGENPEILSVIRLLVKAFQYDLGFSQQDFAEMKKVVDAFDASKINNASANRRIADTAKKLVMHATNIEYAMNRLDELGLRKKLISMGNKDVQDSSAWWLNKEPLRSKAFGPGTGKTAKELNIDLVAHETSSFLAYESITRAHSGEPNVLISRNGFVGEGAGCGDGFYTQMGKYGARGTGLTIRFRVDPNAREGTDFSKHDNYIVFKNKKALKVIQESLNFSLSDLIKLSDANSDFGIDHSDLALVEKLKRKLNAVSISEELEKLMNSPRPEDRQQLMSTLSAFSNPRLRKMIGEEVIRKLILNIFSKYSQLKNSKNDVDIKKYLDWIAPSIELLDEMNLLKKAELAKYLDRILSSHQIWSLRMLAAEEKLVLDMDLAQTDLKKYFNESAIKLIAQEVRSWNHSKDSRQRAFRQKINEKWVSAIEEGDISTLAFLVDTKIFDLNDRNASGFSLLTTANYFGHRNLVQWLSLNPNYDLNLKNAEGLTDLEQLRLLGESKLADRIQSLRPDAVGRNFDVQERNLDQTEHYPKGTPILNFVKIQVGTFEMGETQKVKVNITQPFEVMSTLTTQKMWKDLLRLSSNAFGDSIKLNSDPSATRGDFNPVDSVSYTDMKQWIRAANELSKLDDPQIQGAMREIFPGHRKDDLYRLPTEAEWEYVARMRGLATGKYSPSNRLKNLEDYIWYEGNSRQKSHVVGLKKPILINGQPIYDLQGNVWQLVEYASVSPSGDVDPHTLGHLRDGGVMRGGSYREGMASAKVGRGDPLLPDVRHQSIGFRLARFRH